jgi:hypothetical protein
VNVAALVRKPAQLELFTRLSGSAKMSDGTLLAVGNKSRKISVPAIFKKVRSTNYGSLQRPVYDGAQPDPFKNGSASQI